MSPADVVTIDHTTPPATPPHRHPAYRFEMIHADGTAVSWFDDPADGWELLRPGYASLDADGRHAARLDVLATATRAAQTEMAAGADLSPFNARDRAALTWGPAATGAVEWTHALVLICVDDLHEPFTDRPRPIGLLDGREPDSNVWWVSAVDEDEALLDAGRLGVCSLAIHDPDPEP